MSMLRTNNVESLDSSVSIAVKSIALNGEDYISLGAYTSGLVVNKYSETFSYNGMEYRPLSSLTLPYTTDGSGAPEIANFLPVGDAALRQDLADPIDPENGSAILGRSAVVVGSVADLLAAKQDVSQAIFVKGYIPTTNYGGGVFQWVPSRPRADHNGALVISPTVPWNGAQASIGDFLSGVGETSPGANGCWVRAFDSLLATYFGLFLDREVDSSPAFSAAVNYAAENHLELVLPDSIFGVHQPVVVDGASTLFATVKIKGTFNSSATALGYIPNRCGSVIYTKGNTALEIRFNDFRNENYALEGVGFCDESFFPAEAPMSLGRALLIKKGTPDGENGRYITGNILRNVSFYGYVQPIEVVGVAAGAVVNSVSKNYVGPTTFENVNASKCGDALLLTDCTMNHLWWNNSILFGLDGYGVRVSKTETGSGGNVVVTYSNVVFEGMLGMVSTAGANPPVLLSGIRNKLTLNSCNHEYCGAFGPSGVEGVYSGNPLGSTVNTDVYINGVWTKELGFGETTLPTIDTGGKLFATTEVTVAAASPGEVMTKELVNAYNKSDSLAIGASVETDVTIAAQGGFVVDLEVTVAGGALGLARYTVHGQNGVAPTIFEIFNEVSVSITVSVTALVTGVKVTVTNGSGFAISRDIKAKARTLAEVY